MSAKRDRGRVLTPDGLSRLQQAMRAWELEQEVRCTQERIKELTSAVKEGGLDPGTTRKILKAKEGVDQESIRCLFTTFGLQLNESDLISSSRFQIQSDPNFVGREGAIGDLNTLINRGAKVIVIQARGGVGKTTLARKYLQQEFGSYLEFPIAKETKDIASIESLIEEKLRQLGEEPGREFFVSLDRLKRKLQDERIGILIDNLEPALDAAGKLIEPHRRYVELLRILADPVVQSITLITSRERLNEHSISPQHYPLRELSLAAWEQFFQNRFSLEGKIFAHESATLEALHKAYGGNAKAMDILCGAILTDYAGKMEAYWQVNQDDLLIERALEDLVVGQFDRLQQTEPDAYNLLCRMGCYRYQDVPTVPIEALLSLLWDVPENRLKRVVKSLQDRSLVEFANGEYWLHPIIRGEAIRRLRESADWERSNCRAATFWTEDVKTIEVVEDALRAFEAYFHYVGMHAYEKAGDIIAFDRYSNKSRRMQSLGGSLIRLGVWQPITSEISQITSEIEPGYCLSNLYRILTNAYLLTGQIQNAIECSEKSGTIAQSSLEKTNTTQDNDNELCLKLGTLYRLSLMNIGLCRIFLRELDKAELIFRTLVPSSASENNKANNYNFLYEYGALAFLCSCSGRREETLFFAERGCNELLNSKHWYDIWHLGYGTLFLGLAYQNLEMFEKSYELYRQAVDFSEQTSYFSQIKASALTGLASLHRKKNELSLASAYHTEAINLLEKIGARGDLAEAYYQLAITCQLVGEVEKSHKSFQEAIRLFNEMGAQKQVERVKQSMLTVDD